MFSSVSQYLLSLESPGHLVKTWSLPFSTVRWMLGSMSNTHPDPTTTAVPGMILGEVGYHPHGRVPQRGSLFTGYDLNLTDVKRSEN